MENGDPATPEDIKASVERGSALFIRLVLQSTVVEKEKPFQRQCICFYDESNGFLLPQILGASSNLACTWVVREDNDAILPIHKRI